MRGDLGERCVEDVVQQEGGALQRRQPVERQQQRKRKIVGEFGGGYPPTGLSASNTGSGSHGPT